MRYRNKRTGAVIETTGKVSGGDWEEIVAVVAEKKTDSTPKAVQPKTQTTKAAAKSTASRAKKK